MGKGFNWYMKKLNETVFDREWMANLYGSKRADQQKELKKLFTQISDNDATTAEKETLTKKAEGVQENVERLEAKMAVLSEALAENQAQIDKEAKAITNLVTKADGQAQELEQAHKNLVKRSVDDVFYYLKRGDIGPDAVTGEIRKRIGNSSSLRAQGKLDQTLARLDSKEAEVASIATEADKWIAQRNILEAQYGATKSTYDLLNTTASRIGEKSSTYTNSDFDKIIPVYSPEKIALISKYSQNPMINVEAGKNTNYIEGSKKPEAFADLATITEKYKEKGLLKPEQTTNLASIKNGAVKTLGEALEAGLIEDLASAGLNITEVEDFLVENFSTAYITKNEDGTLNIPPGREEESTKIYNSLVDKLANYKPATQSALNTWDELGNTITSNKQIASLAENYEMILKDMKESGFTFKEAMYTMFDPNYGIFKNSGVKYDINKQGENLNYSIVAGGDKETTDMYEGMSQLIYENWGVKPTYNGNKYKETTPTKPKTVTRNDPFSFNLGDENNVFTFVIDRNNDGEFNNLTEFVGADSKTNWLEDMKSFDKNNDGIINGEELDSVMLLNTKFKDNVDSSIDNNEYTPNKTAVDKNYKRGSSTEVSNGLISASSLGIESINLSQLTDENVNQGGNIFDANGAELFNDSFTFTMKDGTQVSAKRKDETSEYMNKVYNSAFGKTTKLGFSEEQVQSVMDKDYGEVDKFNAKNQNIFENAIILKNAGNTAAEAKKMAQKTKDAMAEYQSAELTKASNKAAAFKDVSSWPSLRESVMAIVRAEGLPENEEQLEGIHTLSGSYDAREIVEMYKEQVQKEEKNKEDKETIREAWKSLIKVTQAGIPATAEEIEELLKSGQAKNADDVLRILSEIKQGVEVETDVTVLDFDSEREKEIYETFNKIFNEAGLNDKVVVALEKLCEMQLNNPKYMQGKSAEELAKDIMEQLKSDKK